MQRWCVCSRTPRQLFIFLGPSFKRIGKSKFGGYEDGSRYPKSHNQMEHHRRGGNISRGLSRLIQL